MHLYNAKGSASYCESPPISPNDYNPRAPTNYALALIACIKSLEREILSLDWTGQAIGAISLQIEAQINCGTGELSKQFRKKETNH